MEANWTSFYRWTWLGRASAGPRNSSGVMMARQQVSRLIAVVHGGSIRQGALWVRMWRTALVNQQPNGVSGHRNGSIGTGSPQEMCLGFVDSRATWWTTRCNLVGLQLWLRLGLDRRGCKNLVSLHATNYVWTRRVETDVSGTDGQR